MRDHLKNKFSATSYKPINIPCFKKEKTIYDENSLYNVYFKKSFYIVNITCGFPKLE